jgi:uncharacterized membrane protein
MILINLTGYTINIDPYGPFGMFLSYLMLFIIGSFLGYIVEVFFRRFVSMHKWINPGFLKGPCLPLYGFGLCALHFCSDYGFRLLLDANDPMANNSFYGIKMYDENGVMTLFSTTGSLPFWAVSIIVILVIGILITLIEFIAGLIFVKGMQIQLWDYSKLKGNILGVICPLFSVIWTAVGAIYWFGLRPIFSALLFTALPHTWGITFLIGAAYAILIVDLVASIKLSFKVRGEAINSHKIVDFEKLKLSFKTSKAKSDKLISFKESINQSFAPLNSKLYKLYNKAKAHMYINNELPEKQNSSETPRIIAENMEKNKENNANSDIDKTTKEEK